VVLDRRLDHTARKLEVTVVEPAADDHGQLDEEHDFFQDAVRVAPLPQCVEP
jgi:hypothetical protein